MFRVFNRTVSACQKPAVIWASRYWGFVYTLQQVLWHSDCAADFDFEFLVVFHDGPEMERRDANGKVSRPVNNVKSSIATISSTYHGPPVPTFSNTAMRGSHTDIPVPTHAPLERVHHYMRSTIGDCHPRTASSSGGHLERQHADVPWHEKLSIVKSVRGPNTWFPDYGPFLEALYGPTWFNSHRVAMCRYPKTNWTDFGITTPLLTNWGRGTSYASKYACTSRMPPISCIA